MRPVGYLTNYHDGLKGERGAYYDYILAGNGIWIEAAGKWLTARIPVCIAEVRGLAPLEQSVVLPHGQVPAYLFDLAVSEMMKTVHQERYVAITYSGDYHLTVPVQDDSTARVKYSNPDSVVVDLHSHGTLGAGFSGTDNEDDQGLRISVVVGRLDKGPEMLLRVGVYGYHNFVAWGDIFKGNLVATGVKESSPWFDEPAEAKEVSEIGLQDILHGVDTGEEPHRSRVWWDRWFRK